MADPTPDANASTIKEIIVKDGEIVLRAALAAAVAALGGFLTSQGADFATDVTGGDWSGAWHEIVTWGVGAVTAGGLAAKHQLARIFGTG